MTASPLLLHHADEVILLEDGVATTRGRHADLLAGSAAYRSVVVRGTEGTPTLAERVEPVEPAEPVREGSR